jgi:hypothetical protein
LYQEDVERVPFFRDKPVQFITSVVTYLKLEYYAPVSGHSPGGNWLLETGTGTKIQRRLL